MKYILIDTCSWVDLLTEDRNKLLPHIEFWVKNECLTIVTHEIIIDEWNIHKEKQKRRFLDSLTTKYRHTKEIVSKENLPIPRNLSPNFKNIENQIITIDEILLNSLKLNTPKEVKVLTSDRTISKKAPFHNKLDSTKDAYIIFSALSYFSDNSLGKLVFVSANKHEFGDPNNIENELHSELLETFPNIEVQYFASIGKCVEVIKGEMPMVMPTSITKKSKVEDEIYIDKNKSLLDQTFDYLSFLKSEINFIPLQILTNHYPFKSQENSISYYSLFSISTNNDRLVELFKSIKIEEEKKVVVVNPEIFHDTQDYEKKINFILSSLSQNLVFHISDYKSREQFSTRLFDEKECHCANCNFKKLKFVDSFNSLVINSQDGKKMLENAYLHYKIGNYVFAINKIEEAREKFNNKNKNLLFFISQYNLTKLSIFVWNNYFGQNSQKELLQKLEEIDISSEAIKMTTVENKKIINYLLNDEFYSSTRDKMQASTKKITDHYYSQLNGGWSSNSEVWILINEYAKLESFLNSNYIIYDRFKEFKDIVNIFVEGLLASHGIDEDQESRLNYFDDWLILQMLQYSDSDFINSCVRKYNIKKIQYLKSSNEGDSFLELIENFFSNNDSLRESFNLNCEANNSKFWEYYNSIFRNILTLFSLCKFDEERNIWFSEKLLSYLEKESYLNRQSFKYVEHYLYRCGNFLNEELLYRFFILGLNKSGFHKSDYFDAIFDISESKNIKFTISEKQFLLINNLAFDFCKICETKHSNSIIVPIYNLIKKVKFKIQLQKIIIETLNKKFDFNLFYLSTLFEVIDLDFHLLEEALEMSLPKDEKSNVIIVKNRFDKNRNDSINSLLNLCFKFDIDTTIDLFEPVKKLDTYYEWLIDMDNFDYSKFNYKWIDEYRTIFFQKKIYGSKVVRDNIQSFLINNNDSILEKNYVDIFIRKKWEK